MKINVGSKNPVKVGAVKEVLEDYELFKDAEIIIIDADSDVSEQPIGFEEIINGAKNRAKNSFIDCNYSFGIESGLFKTPGSENLFNICICAIFDGNKFGIGMSSVFQIPEKVKEIILKDKTSLGHAFNKSGLTNHKNIGYTNEGVIGMLTSSRITRLKYTIQAIIMALTQIEHKELY